MLWVKALVGVLALLVPACGAEEGRVRVEVRWPDGRPLDLPPQANVTLRVEAREDVTEPGEVLFESAPQLLAEGLRLAISDIPVGPSRVLVLEVRPTSEPSSRVLYHGVSEPFRLRSGTQGPTAIIVEMKATPQAPEGCLPLEIVAPESGIVGPGPVTVLLRSELATRARLSNLGRLVPDDGTTETLVLADLEPFGASGPCPGQRLAEWDLDRSVAPCAEAEADLCTRFVFARFIDAYGYAGPVEVDEVRVDSRPPKVIASSVQVRLLPPEESLVATVRSLTRGATIELAFAFDEPVVGEPNVVARDEAGFALGAFTLTERDGVEFTYEWSVPDEPASLSGAYVVQVSSADVHGNRGVDPDVARFMIDDVSPPEPRVDEPSQETFVRIPWGAELTRGVPQWRLVGEPGAVEPNSVVIVRDEEGREVGRQTADESGAFGRDEPLLLSIEDVRTVFVLAVDGASNRSAEVPVTDVVWVASLGTGGGGLSNPHAAFVTQEVRPTLWQSANGLGDRSLSDRERSATVWTDGSTVSVQGSAFGWLIVEPTRLKVADGLSNHGAVFDPVRGRVMVSAFVERSLAPSVQLEAEFHDHEWIRVAEVNIPAREGAVMAYDGIRGGVLLFGGRDPHTGAALDDQWFHDGTRWMQDTPDTVPPPRWDAAADYDPVARRIVLLGGRDGRGLIAESGVWSWDGRTWVASGGGPSPRAGHSMVWNDRVGQLVVFGGETPSEGATSELFAGTGGQWSRLVSTRTPAARTQHAAAYDPAAGRVVVHGGETADGSVLADVWSLVEGSWTEIGVQNTPPPPRARHRAVYDAIRERLMFIGGRDPAGTPTPDVWVLYPGDWGEDVTQPINEVWPEFKQWSAVGYHPRRREVVQFGGALFRGGLVDRTLVWNGDVWRDATGPGDLRPSPRFGLSLAYDPNSDSVIMVGGCGEYDPQLQEDCDRFDPLGDTWRWDGAWTQLTTATATAPGARAHAAFGWDSVEQRLLLVGGDRGFLNRTSDTWAFDGARWEPVSLASPAPSSYGGKLGTVESTGQTVLLTFDPLFSDGRGTPPAIHELTTEGWTKVTDLRPVETSELADALWLPERETFVHTRGFAYSDGAWGFAPEIGFTGVLGNFIEAQLSYFHPGGLLYAFIGATDSPEINQTRVDRQALGWVASFQLPPELERVSAVELVVEGGALGREPGHVVEVWDGDAADWEALYLGTDSSVRVSVPTRLVDDAVEVRMRPQHGAGLLDGFYVWLDRLELSATSRSAEASP